MKKFLDILLKIIKPHGAILALLVPVSIALLTLSFTVFGEASVVAIVSYVIAAYTLTALVMRIKDIINFVKRLLDNKYVKLVRENDGLRSKLTLFGTMLLNLAYAIFQLVLGIYHNTFWYISFAVYYFLLSFMKYYLFDHQMKYDVGVDRKRELGKYMATGVILSIMALVLATIIGFMVVFDRTFVHHAITTIAMAAFTFTTLTISIVDVIRHRKDNNPIHAASRAISLTSALVSMITLETSMLTVFGQENGPIFRRIMLAISGGVVVIAVLSFGIFMIKKGAVALANIDNCNGEKIENE